MQLTSEDVQRYIRILLYWISGALVHYGFATPDATWLPIFIGIGTTLLNGMWTLYGGRVQAKINEVSQLVNPNDPNMKLIRNMEVSSIAVANAAPPNVIPSPAATK